jgi:hypothetical protein
MIGTIRRHTQWLWWFIIAATIFSFVAYFSPNQRNGTGLGLRNSSSADLGSINGEPITSEQLLMAEREASLFFYLRTHAFPETEDQKKQILQIARQNLVIQSLLNEYKITATTEAAARYLKQMFGVPQGQAMPQDKLAEWVRNELYAKGGLTMDDLDRFARQQTAQEYLMSLFGMSGELITPKEVEFFYRRENEPMAAEIISFPTTNYYAATAPTDADLQDYFTKHEAEYRLPDRVSINYVAFFPSNYEAKADQLLGTNLDEKVDELYHQQGPEAFRDESGQILSNTVAEAKIKKQWRLEASMNEARKDANAFLSALSEGHDATHPYTPSDLEKLAKARGLAVKTTEPFDEKNGSKELDLPPKTLHMLFALRDDAADDPERSSLYASSPLRGETAVYVAGLDKQMPSQLQPLSAVREQVLKDYRDAKALALAKEAGDNCAEAVQLGLTQGKSFEAVCAAQNVKPEPLPPFALTTTNLPPGFDKSSFQQLQEAVFPLPTGQSTKYIPTTDGGVVAYLKARLPVDELQMAQELPNYIARMREQRQVAAFSAWLNHQIQLRLVVPPTPSGAG